MCPNYFDDNLSLESNSHCVTDPRIDRQRTGRTKKIYLGRILSLSFSVWLAPWPRDSLSAEGGRKWLAARREGVPRTVAKLNSSIYLKLRLNPPFRFDHSEDVSLVQRLSPLGARPAAWKMPRYRRSSTTRGNFNFYFGSLQLRSLV